jgi:hypothetical protein
LKTTGFEFYYILVANKNEAWSIILLLNEKNDEIK